MTHATWKTMGIALLFVPALVSARPHDAYQQQIPGCAKVTVSTWTDVDPPLQVFRAQADNTCDATVQVRGTLELWVAGRLVESAPLDQNGRASLEHWRPTFLTSEPACAVVRGVQVQSCDHRTNDTPGHLRHAASFPIETDECRSPEF